MVRASSASGESLVNLTRTSLNSIPSAWSGGRSISAPRRWAPIHFSPLASMCNFQSIQSLPVTPVPPASPTFSEPPVLYSLCSTLKQQQQEEDVLEEEDHAAGRQRPFCPIYIAAEGRGRPLEAIREGIASEQNYEYGVAKNDRQQEQQQQPPGAEQPQADQPLGSTVSQHAQGQQALSTQHTAMDNGLGFGNTVRGPTFKATAKPGQTAVWTPRATTPAAVPSATPDVSTTHVADAPPPPPPMVGQPAGYATRRANEQRQQQPAVEAEQESRSTVEVPQTESVAALRSKIQSQMDKTKTHVVSGRSRPPADQQPVGAIKSMAVQFDQRRLRNDAETMDVSPETTQAPPMTYRTPLYTDVKSPSPAPSIPPTPVELLSPYGGNGRVGGTSSSDGLNGGGGGGGAYPWATRTLNRTPVKQNTIRSGTLLRSVSRRDGDSRPADKDFQHHWYKMMFKKLHQIDKDEDKSVMRYRVRDHAATEPPKTPERVAPKVEPASVAQPTRHFFSPEPVVSRDTLEVSSRYNRSKSVGRTWSPSPTAQLATTAVSSSSAATVGFRHQPGRIEDYVPGHSSIVESRTATAEAGNTGQPSRSSLQAVLDTSQSLLQRILGDLSREVEQRKAQDETQTTVDSRHLPSACSRRSTVQQQTKNRLRTWSQPVCSQDPGSKLYALERSKTLTFHLPPYRLRDGHSRSRRMLHRINESLAEGDSPANGRKERPKQISLYKTDHGSAYEAILEQLDKAVEDIDSMSETASDCAPPKPRLNVNWSVQSFQLLSGEGGGPTSRRHSITSCSLPFCQLCIIQRLHNSSSCSSFGSDSFYLTRTGDDVSDRSPSVDTNTEWDIGSAFSQRQKHATLRSRSALDQPRSFQTSNAPLQPRRTDLYRKSEADTLSRRGPTTTLSDYSKPSRAKALYNFVAQNPRELDLEPGDLVTVRRQIDANWCEGEINGRVGIFPTNYVEFAMDKAKSPLATGRARSTAKVLYDFVARRPRELTIKQGEVVHLVREIDRNWTLGFNELGQEGLFPSHYVKACVLASPDKSSQSPPTGQARRLQRNNNPSGFASAFDSTVGSKSTVDHVSRLVIDGVPYDGSATKSESLDAILNEMKLYSTSLVDPPKANRHAPRPNPGTVLSANHSTMSASKIDTYEAMYDYGPENPDELELKRGDIVYVVESCDDGWFIGTSLRTGRFGTFPGNYVKHL